MQDENCCLQTEIISTKAVEFNVPEQFAQHLWKYFEYRIHSKLLNVAFDDKF